MPYRSIGVAALIACVLSSASASAQALVSPAVIDEANRGSVRVLIRLQTPTAPEGRLAGPSAIADQRQRIATAQNRVLASIGRSARLRRFRSVPWIATEVTRAQLALLTRHPSVAAIQRDVLMRPALAQSVPFIGAPVFWQVGYVGDGWTVAVLDTGVDKSHLALAGRVVHEACFSTTSPADGATSFCAGGAPSTLGSGSAPPCPLNITGCEHGTLIAGVVASRNSQNTGVAPNVNIAAIQVYSRIDDPGQCQGPCALSFTSDQVAALEHVLEMAGPSNQNRIAAANLSLSSTELSESTCDTDDGMPAFKDAVDNLRAIGIPTVVASGNHFSVNMIGHPACVSTAISVGASAGNTDVLSGIGNRASILSLVAPGEDITSTVPNNGFRTVDGTSLSAAFVSGGWALLKQFMPNASVPTLLGALQNTGVPLPDSTQLTYPRIRLVEAALFANAGLPVPPGAPQDANAAVSGGHVNFSWAPPISGNGLTRYVVSAGSQAGASDIGTFDVGFSTSIAAIVGQGSYWVRVRADNPAGPGPSTSDVMFTITPPGAPSMFASQVAGSTVTLTWQAPMSGSVPASYVVEAGTEAGLSNIVVFDTASAQPVIVVGGVPPGAYHVRVRAKNEVGIGAVSNEITVIVP